MEGRQFYSLLISFFLGVALASCFGFWQILILFGLAAASVSLFLKKYLFLGCAIFFVIGTGRFEIASLSAHPLDPFVGTVISLNGFVSAEPDISDTAQRLYLKSDDYSDRFVLSLPSYPRFEYGDRLSVTGTLRLPENFETFPGGPVFDYVSYLSKDRVRYVIDRPRAALLGKGGGSSFLRALFSLKAAFMGNIREAMPEPHSSLVAGILLGEKSSLPKALVDSFRRAGLTHILVLSGSNVSIIASSLMSVLAFLPKSLSRSIGALSIVSFALMTGASSTTIRASLMALLLIMVKGAGRGYDVSRALVLAAFFMVLDNPFILNFDIGFQLSLMSTLALVYVGPISLRYLSWIPERFSLRDIIATTLSTQVFILPFMVYKMGEVSIISLLTNILVLPAVPWSMFLGFLTGIAGFLGRLPAVVFAVPEDLLLSWIMRVVLYFGNLKIASIKASLGLWGVFLIYMIYIWIIFRWRLKNSSRRSAS